MQITKPEIFDYIDYRKYLADFYHHNKSKDPSFSLRYFSAQAGLRSYNYLKFVIDGKRRLTPTFFKPFSKALKLNPREEIYFAKLVELNEAHEPSKQSEILDHLLKLRSKSELHRMKQQKMSIYREWYFIPLIELTESSDFQYKPSWIASRLGVPVSTVKKAIQTLLECGVLEEKGGTLTKTYKVADSEDEISNAIIQSYHQKNLQIAAQKIVEQNVEEREFGSVTFAASEERMKQIKSKIKQFRKEIFDLLENPDGKTEGVFQLNLQFFRVTEKSDA